MDAKTKKLLDENDTIRIMYESFMQMFKDEKKAFGAINHIAEKVKEPGCKLIHLGNVVFLITVSGSHLAEMHAMIGGNPTEAEKVKELGQQIDKLLPMLKKLGAKVAYTYMPPDQIEKFRPILKKHKFYERPVEVNGKKLIATYVEV
jgi:hypothetical protein